MEKSEKKEILSAMLNSQDLGDKTKQDLLNALENEVAPETNDPLSRFIFEAVTDGSDAEEIASSIDYAVSQMTKAQNAIKQTA